MLGLKAYATTPESQVPGLLALDGTTQSELGPPASVRNQEMSHRLISCYNEYNCCVMSKKQIDSILPQPLDLTFFPFRFTQCSLNLESCVHVCV